VLKRRKRVCWSQNAAALTGSICEKDITQGQPCELGWVGFLSNFIFLQWTPVNDGDETQPHISSVTDKKQQGGQAQAPCQECPMTSPCRRSLFPVSLPPTPLKNNRKSKYPQHFSQLCNRVDGLLQTAPVQKHAV
jgi:hypothetical protein